MIRRMTKEDLPVVIQLEERIFSSPWNLESFEGEFDHNPYAELYVYELDGQIIGYCDLWIMFEQAQIANIAVSPEYRRNGYAQELMNYMIFRANSEQCETMSLEVRVSNDSAINLYEKNDFIKANIRKNYYEDNHEDAWLMICPLGGN